MVGFGRARRAAAVMQRRFWPLFVVQATGGLNDNLYKSAVVILLVFRGEGGAGLSALAGGTVHPALCGAERHGRAGGGPV